MTATNMHQPTAFLDAADLHLSGNTETDLDGFDFILDDDDMACSGDVGAFDCLLPLSMDIDAISEGSESDAIREIQAEFVTSTPRSSRRSQRERRPSFDKNEEKKNEKKRSRTSVKNNIKMEMDFDPPVREIFTRPQSDSSAFPSRAMSHSDLSMCSHHSHHTHTSHMSTLSTTSYTESQYNEALNNLAESMKRSEESRRVVAMMKRRMLSPEQQAALSDAKERLAEQNERVQRQVASSSQSSVGQSGVMGSLFSASRRVCSYMGQVNQQTL